MIRCLQRAATSACLPRTIGATAIIGVAASVGAVGPLNEPPMVVAAPLRDSDALGSVLGSVLGSRCSVPTVVQTAPPEADGKDVDAPTKDAPTQDARTKTQKPVSPDRAAERARRDAFDAAKALARAASRRGDIDAALAAWSEAEAVVEDAPDQERRARREEIARSRAHGLHHAGRFEDAVREIHASIARAEERSAKPDSSMLLLLARAELARGELDAADAALGRLRRDIDRPGPLPSSGERLDAAAVELRLLRAQGRTRQAEVLERQFEIAAASRAPEDGPYTSEAILELREATGRADLVEILRWERVRAELERNNLVDASNELDALIASLERMGATERAARYKPHAARLRKQP
jgi:hypothetical protein